jgi:hypothetical protein
MFASHDSDPTAPEALSDRLAAVVREFAGVEAGALSSAQAVECLRELERVKNAAAGLQARIAVGFEQRQREDAAQAGVPSARRSRGVGAQIGLARQESPFMGSRHLGLGRVLTAEMPVTLAALCAGDVTEWRATILARETAALSAEHRAAVDAELGPRLGRMGDRAVEREAKALAYRLDPASVLGRMRGAVKNRRVSIRPGPESMVYLSGYLPQRKGIACYAALRKAASLIGDERSLGQVMADLMIERLTGTSAAEDVAAEVVLVVDEETLLGGGDAPGRVPGVGPVPASQVRDWIRESTAPVWLRRVWQRPADGALIAMESRRRVFEGQLRKLVIVRDDVCRTPWCDAVIKHIDHVVPAADGGPTSADNGQGLCEACNYAKEAPGWSAQTVSGSGPHTVRITTPTGHTYTSQAPRPPGAPPPKPPGVDAMCSHLERRLAIILADAA